MEEKEKIASAKWAVDWSNASRKLALMGWWMVLLSIILLIISTTAIELIPNMPRPNVVFDRIFGITLTALFCFTILCFLSSFAIGITSLIAPLFNIVSYKDIKRNALRGIFYSILYFLVFLVLMIPSISRRIKGAKFQCRRNINLTSDELIRYPEYIVHNWCDALKDEPTFDIDFLKCNYDKIGPCSYAMNENIPADANELPGDLVLLFESAPGWNQTGGSDDVVTDRHKRHDKPGANIAFADGHVEFVEAEKIRSLKWKTESEE